MTAHQQTAPNVPSPTPNQLVGRFAGGGAASQVCCHNEDPAEPFAQHFANMQNIM